MDEITTVNDIACLSYIIPGQTSKTLPDVVNNIVLQPPPALTLLELERQLRLQVMQLEKTKHDRMKITRKLQRRDQALCDLFITTPYYIPTGIVPSEEQIKELEEHVSALEAQKVCLSCFFVGKAQAWVFVDEWAHIFSLLL